MEQSPPSSKGTSITIFFTAQNTDCKHTIPQRKIRILFVIYVNREKCLFFFQSSVSEIRSCILGLALPIYFVHVTFVFPFQGC